MNRERFIKQRRSDWKLFEQLMTRLKGTRTGRWKSDDIADLARLYRSICYDNYAPGRPGHSDSVPV